MRRNLVLMARLIHMYVVCATVGDDEQVGKPYKLKDLRRHALLGAIMHCALPFW